MIIRCLWPFANRLLRLPGEVPRFLKTVPDFALHLGRYDRTFGNPRHCRSNIQGLHRSLDRKVLFPLGYGIREKVRIWSQLVFDH